MIEQYPSSQPYTVVDPEPDPSPGPAPNPDFETQWDTLGHDETQKGTACLTPRQLVALPIIANAPNLRQAARDANIARSTLYRWLDTPAFRDELEHLGSQVAALARANYKIGTLRSFHTLDDLMEHPNPWVRHSASRTMSNIGFRITEGDELRQQMRDLENLFAAQAGAQDQASEDTFASPAERPNRSSRRRR